VQTDLSTVKESLISSARTNKQERFMRSVAERLTVIPPDGTDFLLVCGLALKDSKNDFDEHDRHELRKAIPDLVRDSFSPDLVKDIISEWELLKKRTALLG
jgi:hypothetical protein